MRRHPIPLVALTLALAGYSTAAAPAAEPDPTQEREGTFLEALAGAKEVLGEDAPTDQQLLDAGYMFCKALSAGDYTPTVEGAFDWAMARYGYEDDGIVAFIDAGQEATTLCPDWAKS